jgi:predicted PurR-regulated permease PerM
VTDPQPRAGRVLRQARRDLVDGSAPVDTPTGPARASVNRLARHSPFAFGLYAGFGALVAWWLGGLLLAIGSILVLVAVAAFIAVGLNPAVELLERRGVKRVWAVLAVIVAVLLALALFIVALVPVITDQVSAIVANAPDWFRELQHNRTIQRLDQRYHIVDHVQSFVTDKDFGASVFGGVVGVGLKVLSLLANTFVVIVLTLYFLASLPSMKQSAYRLAPASRRTRVAALGDEILGNIGAYVSGAFLVAMCAGISSLVFLFVVGLGKYAVALAAVVTLLDVIPMIGATLGAVIVTAVGFATEPKIGLFCLIFYVVYQQFENYVVYPRVMARSVDLAGSFIVIAALVGAALLGVVGALLAIPTAAAIQLLVKELLIPRQQAR